MNYAVRKIPVYWQCYQCKKFTCDADYHERAQVGFTKCPECGGSLVRFPFTCSGCGLDFNDQRDLLSSKISTCPLCGYVLEHLKHLIPVPYSKPQYHGQTMKNELSDKSIEEKGQDKELTPYIK